MSNVSVIMPCHNGAAYIADAIRSVQNQTYSDWELFVIDDCSNDDSVGIINGFAENDDRIKLLHTQKSTGYPSDVRNLGISTATGRYIAFLDCDDMWLPEKLEHQLKLFDKPEVAVAYSWYIKMDEDGTQHDKPIKSPELVTYKKLLGGNVIGNLTGVYDTNKLGKIFQKQIHHEDYLMWLEILKFGYIAANTNSIEAIYRESKNSLSGSKLKALVWTWNIFYKELKMGLFRSIQSFACYVIKGLFKFVK